MPLYETLVDHPTPDAIALTPLYAGQNGEGIAVPPFARASGFTGAAGTFCLLPSPGGGLDRVLVGLGDGGDAFALGDLPAKLPDGTFLIDPPLEDGLATEIALAWAVGGYAFDRYKDKRPSLSRLVWPRNADRAVVRRTARAIALVRDLVNTPAEDMGPADLRGVAEDLAAEYGATVSVITGDALLDANYPAIHAVGRASPRPPCLIDLTWGDESAPLVTLVGKGVCFDTGGLDLKPASAMKLMKKDMGGAAHALAVALMVMDAGLPVRLRVLIPAVDNAVAGNAFRPGDVLRTRKGLTVEVGNTDAEGRLILCDALAEADDEGPEVLIDFATLTGAARVALGPEVPALFANDDPLAEALLRASRQAGDPLWRLPLWPGYRQMVDGKIADLDNAPEGGMAGAITAGLFLERFVSPETPWAHIDCYAWNQRARPGRPMGGEAQGIRAVFMALSDRFG